jgi:hypothetical protein
MLSGIIGLPKAESHVPIDPPIRHSATPMILSTGRVISMYYSFSGDGGNCGMMESLLVSWSKTRRNAACVRRFVEELSTARPLMLDKSQRVRMQS